MYQRGPPVVSFICSWCTNRKFRSFRSRSCCFQYLRWLMVGGCWRRLCRESGNPMDCRSCQDACRLWRCVCGWWYCRQLVGAVGCALAMASSRTWLYGQNEAAHRCIGRLSLIRGTSNKGDGRRRAESASRRTGPHERRGNRKIHFVIKQARQEANLCSCCHIGHHKCWCR